MNKLILSSAILLLFLFGGCRKNNTPTAVLPSNNYVYGKVKFLDGSAAGFANINLRIPGVYQTMNTVCDKSGNYAFKNISSGNYIISYLTTRNDINSAQVPVSLTEGDTVEKDITITYRMLDDYFSLHINKDVFFMKFLPENAMIGNHYELIDYLSGMFRRDMNDSVSLSAEIYEIPDSLDWYNTDSTMTADFIRSHFKYLTEVTEEPVVNHNHEIRFRNNDVKIIMSNPLNGFAFVKKADNNKRLEIPCVDSQNNDFGLLIHYK